MQLNGMKTLLAEDDRVSAQVLRKALARMGCDVTVATDGAEAWRLVGDLQPRLVISDWMMPQMDGLELCRQIRSQADAPYTYVMMLTARGGRENHLEALQAGADDFLVKPVNRTDLLARLNVARRILAMQEELRARQAQLEILHAELERRNRELAVLAITDGLTGLFNRRHFMQVLETNYAFSIRHHQPLSLALIDVDHFKQYNDRYGHPAGDDALRMVADTLRSECRAHDVVARYGGEEFVVLMPATDVDASRTLADRLRVAIETYPWERCNLSASFGIATRLPTSTDTWNFVEEADRALYQSKQHGRNRVTHHDDLLATNVALQRP